MNSYLGMLQHQVFFIFSIVHSYGDRSPKSTLGRVFCILWIITGLIIISIFIAMVTASLAATTHPHFPIHGSLVRYACFFFFLRGQTKFITITRSIVGFHDRECSTVFLQTSIRANTLNSYIRIVLYSFDRFKLKRR